MPAFVAPLVGFALGVLLAWFSAAAPRGPHALRATEPGAAAAPPRSRSVAIAMLFSGLVFTPICAYFLVFAPDWSFAYLVDTRRIPSALDLLLLLLDAASVPVGFVLGRGASFPAPSRAGGPFVAHRSVRAMAVLSGAPLAVAALAVLLLARSLAVEGTYRQIQGDFGARPVAGGPLGYALLWMHTMLAAGFSIAVRALHRRDVVAPQRAAPIRRGRPVPSLGEPVPSPDPPRTAAPPAARRLGVARRPPPGRPERSG